MTENEILTLLKKYSAGNCTPEEIALVESLYLEMEELNAGPSPEDVEKAFRQVRKNLPVTTRNTNSRQWLVAASILFILGICIYLYPEVVKEQPSEKTAATVHFAPGKSQAFLTLSDGQKIPLNDIAQGKIATEGNAVVTKTASGQIAYQPVGNKKLSPVFNTVSTPRGGEYILTLSDGTRVWLNAATTIVYPSSFSGKTREIRIDGEAYFEVAHRPQQPFRVSVGDQTIEVLGTHFNINSYLDEPNLKTTLFEGKVKVSRANQQVYLNPGEQALAGRNAGSLLVRKDINIQQVLAWKNGSFYFDYTDAGTILRQISRWYNVDIQFRGKVPNQRLSGSFSKYTDASTALEILAYAGVNFKIEGRTIIVD